VLGGKEGKGGSKKPRREEEGRNPSFCCSEGLRIGKEMPISKASFAASSKRTLSTLPLPL
jgi:hypothetical protein